MQNTELRRRARPVLDALRTLALQGRTPVLGLRKKQIGRIFALGLQSVSGGNGSFPSHKLL